jgi:hypothetical protein
MTNHVADAGVLLYGVKALFNLVQADDAWKFILETAIVGTVMDACRAYSRNKALHLWTCCFLHQTVEKGQGMLMPSALGARVIRTIYVNMLC